MVRFGGDGVTRFTGLVPALGDVNGDGVEDFGLTERDSSGVSAIEVIVARPKVPRATLGKLGRWSVRLREPGGRESQGLTVSGAGDVNGDGLDDIIFGASRASPQGRRLAGSAFVVFGSRTLREGQIGTADLPGFVIHGPSEELRVGSSVDAAGDVNGDGLGDLILGSDTTLAPTPLVAEAFVVYGKRGGEPVDLAGEGWGFNIRAPDADVRGALVARASDVNGDGGQDAAVLFGGDRHEAQVVFGPVSGDSVDLRADPEAGIRITGGWFHVLAPAGDFNGDGRADIGLGAPRGLAYPNCPFECGVGPVYEDPGSAVVVFGGDAGAVDVNDMGDRGLRIDRLGAAEDRTGYTLAGGADHDGDGYDDLAIAAPGEGSVYVVRGAPGGGHVKLRDAPGRVIRFDSSEEGRRAGRALAWLRRWDRDRLPDLLIAEISSTADGPRAYVVRGFVPGRCRNASRGTTGGDYLGGTPAGDRMFGGAGPDLVAGLVGDDCVFGGPGRDDVRGDGGADRLVGGRGRDRLVGGDGKDTIVDRHGRNHVYGGPGRDRIDTRNGFRDRVECGGGRDTLRADARDVYRGCERIDLPPDGR